MDLINQRVTSITYPQTAAVATTKQKFTTFLLSMAAIAFQSAIASISSDMARSAFLLGSISAAGGGMYAWLGLVDAKTRIVDNVNYAKETFGNSTFGNSTFENFNYAKDYAKESFGNATSSWWYGPDFERNTTSSKIPEPPIRSNLSILLEQFQAIIFGDQTLYSLFGQNEMLKATVAGVLTALGIAPQPEIIDTIIYFGLIFATLVSSYFIRNLLIKLGQKIIGTSLRLVSRAAFASARGVGNVTFNLLRKGSLAAQNVLDKALDFIPETQKTSLLRDEVSRLTILMSMLQTTSFIDNMLRRSRLCQKFPEIMSMDINSVADFKVFRENVTETDMSTEDKHDLIEERLWQLCLPADQPKPTFDQINTRRNNVMKQIASARARRTLRSLSSIFSVQSEEGIEPPINPMVAARYVEAMNRPFFVLGNRAAVETCLALQPVARPIAVANVEMREEEQEEQMIEEPEQEEEIIPNLQDLFREEVQAPIVQEEAPIVQEVQEIEEAPIVQEVQEVQEEAPAPIVQEEVPEIIVPVVPAVVQDQVVVQPIDSWFQNSYEGIKKVAIVMSGNILGQTIISAVGTLLLSNILAGITPASYQNLVYSTTIPLTAIISTVRLYNSQYSTIFFWIVSGLIVPQAAGIIGLGNPISSYSLLFLAHSSLSLKKMLSNDAEYNDTLARFKNLGPYAIAFSGLVTSSLKLQQALDIARSAKTIVISSFAQLFGWLSTLVKGHVAVRVSVFIASLATIMYGVIGYATTQDLDATTGIAGGYATTLMNLGVNLGTFLRTGAWPVKEVFKEKVLTDNTVVSQILSFGKIVVESVWEATRDNLGTSGIFLAIIVGFFLISMASNRKDPETRSETRNVMEIDCLFQWIEVGDERLEMCRDWIAGDRNPDLEILNEFNLGCLANATRNLEHWVHVLKSKGVLSAIELWRSTLKQDELELRAWISMRDKGLQGYLLDQLALGLTNLKAGIDELFMGIKNGILVTS